MTDRIHWLLDREPGTSTLSSPGFIYFIRGELTGRIKIGWATKPGERLKALQTASPDKLLIVAAHPGNGRDEKALHQQFAAHRVHGEWFEGVPEIIAHIQGIIDNPPAKTWELHPDAAPRRTLRESLLAEQRRKAEKAPALPPSYRVGV
jgi:hypothetical protein